MFLTKKFHREILAAQKAESDRIIVALSEQVEYLRQLLGRPLIAQQAAVNPSEQPARFEMTRPWVSEMEEEIEHLKKSGVLTEELAEEAMKEFGLDHEPPLLDLA
jgi:hypothetical protein